MDPFDLKSILLARHAQHVVIVHFPIALAIASVGFDALAWWTKRPSLSVAAYANLTAAAIAAIPAIGTGLLAWHWLLEGASLTGVLGLHLVCAVSSAAVLFLMWVIRWRRRRRNDLSLGGVYIALGIVAVLLIGLTGHLGGVLSGVNA